VKKFLAIVFSIALMTAQSLALAGSAPSAAAKKDCCACNSKCCASKSDNSAKDIPAVPAPSSSQKSFQVVLTLAAWVLTPQINSSETLVSLRAAPLLAQFVPLFTRNCSYLL
jgi:hypothetical protein